ncbi:MAG: cobalamin B12-binding domain-containing protein [bacterium]
MKLLLINPPVREWALPNCFPSGLGYVASYVRKNNPDWEVEVLDVNALRLPWDEVEEFIRGAEYDLAGTGGIITVYGYMKRLVRALKKHHPDGKVIVGGACATSIPRIMMENNPVDVVCIGEGEATCSGVLRALSGGAGWTAWTGYGSATAAAAS